VKKIPALILALAGLSLGTAVTFAKDVVSCGSAQDAKETALGEGYGETPKEARDNALNNLLQALYGKFECDSSRCFEEGKCDKYLVGVNPNYGPITWLPGMAAYYCAVNVVDPYGIGCEACP
jgi:hypothetical protein